MSSDQGDCRTVFSELPLSLIKAYRHKHTSRYVSPLPVHHTHNKHKPEQKNLDVLLINARSIKNKLACLHAYIHKFSFDLVFITETWLKPEIVDSLICPQGYDVLRNDRKHGTRGGGVAVFFKRSLKVIKLDYEIDTAAESLVLEVFSTLNSSHKLRFCCIYLPPSLSRTSNGVRSCCNFIKKVLYAGPIFVLGDFNLPSIDWDNLCSSNQTDNIFLDFCIFENLNQLVLQPTRRHVTGHSLLDLILTNQYGKKLISSVSVENPIASTCDHDSITACITFPQIHPSVSAPQFAFHKANYNDITSKLESTDWDHLLDLEGNGIQVGYNNFLAHIHQIMDQHIPTFFPSNRFKLPLRIRKTLKTKARLYKRLKSDTSLKSEYHIICKAYDKMIKAWFCSIEENICNRKDRKGFYNYAKRKMKSLHGVPAVLKNDGQLITDDIDKANFFNQRFQQVFQTDDSRYLNLIDKTSNSFSKISIQHSDIADCIFKLKGKNSRTPDQLPPVFIKHIWRVLINPLHKLFQFSLNTATLPHQWKTALVNPVFKKGSKNDVLNYRPISLTSTVCRILETIVKNKILEHLYTNNLISTAQHGFLPGRSTTTQLLTTLNTFVSHFDSKKILHVVYTDFSKAFDKVCHGKLIQILTSFGIRGLVLNWIKNFVTNRTQSVYLADATSTPLSISSGIPQGSVLGPLLFLLYIQDIEKICTESCNVSLFADDCKFYSHDPAALQSTLDRMLQFISARQILLSKQKCVHLPIVSSFQNRIPVCFTFEDEDISSVSFVKDLGITISNDLKWKNHISQLTRKAFHAAHKVLFCFSSNNSSTLLLAYLSFVRPILETNCVVWSPHLRTDINKIESVQRFFTRKLFQRTGNSSQGYEDRLNKLRLESLEERRIRFDLIMVYKIVYSLVDLNFDDFFRFRESSYSLRGHSLTLIKSNTKTPIAANFFL